MNEKEHVWFETSDGQIVRLHNPPSISVINLEDMGFPPVDYSTSQSPYQRGVTPLSGRFNSRAISMILRASQNSRDSIWNERERLTRLLNPFRSLAFQSGTLHVERMFRDGTIYHRAIDVSVQKGMNLPLHSSGTKWDEWGFTESLQFVAYDPAWYDPEEQVETSVDLSGQEQLVFPFAFPLLFGLARADETMTVPYLGTVEEFPTIEIDGPIEYISIINTVTNYKIAIQYPVADGDTIYVRLAFDRKQIEDAAGNSLLAYLTDDSNIALFALYYDPIAPNGDNDMDITIFGSGANTEVRFRYYNRYFAI